MKVLRLLLPLLCLAVSIGYAQQAYVDPELRALLRPEALGALRRAPAPMAGRLPTAASGIAFRKQNLLDVPRVCIFARLRNEVALRDLAASGGTVGSRIGSFVTAEVPIDGLAELLASPNFLAFEAAQQVSLTNDSSMKAIRADMVRRADGGAWSGTTGRGVIIGIYDTGLDFTHEDFLDAAGATRVLELWDQTDRANGVVPPDGFNYGRLCTQSAIAQVIANPGNSAPCPEQDIHGHGTHVAGIAAGDGSAIGSGGTPFEFAGVAPLADLMIVKGGDGIFSESAIIDGLKWLERESRRLNRPMAVNLSIGSQSGPHDGTRLYEMMIDSLSRPGFIVAVAAGNDGYNANDFNPDGSAPPRIPSYIHAAGPPGSTRDFTIQIRNYIADSGGCNDFVTLSLWYYAQDTVDVNVLRPDGSVVAGAFGQVRESDSAVGNVRIDNASGGLNAPNHSYQAQIRLDDCGASAAAPAPGTWTVRVSAVRAHSGKPYHLWLYSQSLGSAAFATGQQNFDDHYVISSPANAARAIAIGAFVTRLCWDSPAKPEGAVCYSTREKPGDIARFSSAGPSRSERLKPEIVAPGVGIVSARSRGASVPANRVLADGVHWVDQGTSMAAPAVTGAIALLLQLDAGLTPEAVKSIFARSAEHDAFTNRIYDSASDGHATDWWGYGKLNVCAAIAATGNMPTINAGPFVISPAADTIPVHATMRLYTCSPATAPIIYASENPDLIGVDSDGTVHALAIGAGALVATSGAFADTVEIVVTDAARLAGSTRNIAPAQKTLGKSGALLPLLSTVLHAEGFEPIRITQLSYRVRGDDPRAQVQLVQDANRNGVPDAHERVLATQPAFLTSGGTHVDLQLDSLIVSRRDSISVLMVIALSGKAPNGSTFSAELLPADTRSINLESHAVDRMDAMSGALSSTTAVTGLLADEQAYSFSENPVRSSAVAINFAETPRSAGVYTLTGRLVADLTRRMSGGSVTWDLTNDDGERVASGVYLVVMAVGNTRIARRLFVLGGTQ